MHSLKIYFVFVRVWWIVSIIACLIGSVILISLTVENYRDNPVTVSYAKKRTPIWEIPFPAVTICPQTKSYVDKVNFTKIYLMMKNSPQKINATYEE